MTISRLAAAKVNLFLHVDRPGPDGFHPIHSLMVFADLGDRIRLVRGGPASLIVEGPFAEALGDDDNLVARARDLFVGRFGEAGPLRITLDKTLPVAAGLGGGSADAAATLRAMAEAWSLPPTAPIDAGPLGVIARGLGADVAACLRGEPVIAEGRGDVLSPAPTLPALDAVLVNPGAPTPTAAVYRAFDEAAAWRPLAPVPILGPLATPIQAARWLEANRNDLEAPAIALQPAIRRVLRLLAGDRDCLLARMSGSGSTCFALCAGRPQAERLAARLVAAEPGWWIRPCRLGAAGAA